MGISQGQRAEQIAASVRSASDLRRAGGNPAIPPLKKRVYLTCTAEHRVDDDGEGNERSATVGMQGEAERDATVPPNAPNAYQVEWANGAWGFYSSTELAEVADPRFEK